MTNTPEEGITGGHDETMVEDLLDETRGPEEDAPAVGTDDSSGSEVADDLKPRD